MWTSHPNLLERIRVWWSIEVEGTTMFRVSRKLSNVKRMVKAWNKSDLATFYLSKRISLLISLQSRPPFRRMGMIS